MTYGNEHLKYYELMKQEVPNLKPIIGEQVNKALDHSSEKEKEVTLKKYGIKPKMLAHRNFDYFQKRYFKLIHKNTTKQLIHALKFYWVNHLIADMAHNVRKYNLEDWDNMFKLISKLGEPYNSYGLSFCKTLGITPKSARKSNNNLLIKKKFKINIQKIKLPDIPLKYRLCADYYDQVQRR